jgi:hypothetical protein
VGTEPILGALVFLTPLGALVALLAGVPLAAIAVAVARGTRAAAILGLAPVRRRAVEAAAVLAAGSCALLGVAAAQPVIRTTETQKTRTRSEVFFVVDVSRSMLASPAPSSATRLDRARGAAERLHRAVPDVPSGIAGLTDRVLPYVFPTSSAVVFADTLRRSVAIEAPPPEQVGHVATSFDALASVAAGGFFSPRSEHRTCVLLTDGESRSYAAETVAGALAGRRGCHLLVVRVGGAGDRLYGTDGRVESTYRTDSAAASNVRRLAQDTGGESFDLSRLAAAGAALRRSAEAGPVRRVGAQARSRALSPYAAGLALVLVLVIVVTRLPAPRLRGLWDWHTINASGHEG